MSADCQIKRELDAIEAEMRDLGIDMSSVDALRDREYVASLSRLILELWEINVAQYVFFAEAHERGGYS